MINPWYLYEKLDDGIMYGVNKAVRAWNWTTGRTKVDLANELLTVAPILECPGAMLSFGGVGVVLSGLYILISDSDQRRNKRIETIEEKAKESGYLDARVLSGNNYDHLWGTAWGSLVVLDGTVAITTQKPQDEYMSYLLAAGHLSRSLSHYVMRADSLPPRKNVFSRAKAKLTEKLKAVKIPQILPQPVPQEILLTNYMRREYKKGLEARVD